MTTRQQSLNIRSKIQTKRTRMDISALFHPQSLMHSSQSGLSHGASTPGGRGTPHNPHRSTSHKLLSARSKESKTSLVKAITQTGNPERTSLTSIPFTKSHANLMLHLNRKIFGVIIKPHNPLQKSLGLSKKLSSKTLIAKL